LRPFPSRPSPPANRIKASAGLEQSLGQEIAAALTAAECVEPPRRRVHQSIGARVERAQVLLERREITRGVACHDHD